MNAEGETPLKLPAEPAAAALSHSNSRQSSRGDKPFRWKLRNDLEILETTVGGKSGTERLLRDPLRLSYFHTSAAEVLLLQALDGERTPLQLMQLLNQSSTEQYTLGEVLELLAAAGQAELLVCTEPRLIARNSGQQRNLIFRLLTGWLSFRKVGPDPNQLLQWWCRKTTILDSVPVRFCWLVFQVLVFLQVLSNLDLLRSELPDLQGLMTADGILMTLLLLAGIRILHELGHAAACCRKGGECHDIGLLFVAFFPLLYCDVSDSWRFPSGRDRIRVAAAGIIAESRLAAVCALLWLSSAPGFAHTLFLNILLISSITTLLVNANPLMRYDGYYILSDLLNVPNLSTESSHALYSMISRIVFGHNSVLQPRSLSGQLILALFAAASLVWRTLVILTLLLFVSGLLEPAGMQLLAALPLVGMLPGSLQRLVSGIARGVLLAPRRVRAAAGLTVSLALLGAGLLLPVRLQLHAPCLLTPGECLPVFVRAPGVLVSSLQLGDRVHKGQIIAELNNPDLELKLAEAVTERDQLQQKLNQMERIRIGNADGPAGRNAIAEALESVETRVRKIGEMLQLLTIRSPADGILLPGRNDPVDRELPTSIASWSDYPLLPESRDAAIAAQTLLCWVGEEDDCEVQGWLTQQDIGILDPAGDAVVRFHTKPHKSIAARYVAAGSAPAELPARELILQNLVQTSPREPQRTRFPMFTVNVQSVAAPFLQEVPLYHTGTLQLKTRPISLATWLNRSIQTVFRTETRLRAQN